MTDFFWALLSGTIGGGLIAGVATYIAFNTRLQKLEILNELGKNPFETITRRNFELLQQANALEREINDIRTKISGHNDQIDGLATDVDNYEQIIRLLNKLRDENTNLDSFEKLIEISPEIINIQSKFSNFEGQLNGIEIHKVKTGKFYFHKNNEGGQLQQSDTPKEFSLWIKFHHVFNNTPLTLSR